MIMNHGAIFRFLKTLFDFTTYNFPDNLPITMFDSIFIIVMM